MARLLYCRQVLNQAIEDFEGILLLAFGVRVKKESYFALPAGAAFVLGLHKFIGLGLKRLGDLIKRVDAQLPFAALYQPKEGRSDFGHLGQFFNGKTAQSSFFAYAAADSGIDV